MHIVIVTTGTRGDVQPFLALAMELQLRGHTLCLAAPENFDDFVSRQGVLFFRLQGSMKELLVDHGEGIAGSFGLLRSLLKLARLGTGMLRDGMLCLPRITENADLIIAHPKCYYATDSAEKYGIPVVVTALQPLHQTAKFPFFLFGNINLGPWLNWKIYAILKLQNRFNVGLRNKIRNELLNLPAIQPTGVWWNKPRIRSLCAFSPCLVPRPSDWKKSIKQTGFWFPRDDPDWAPDNELKAFLEAGEKPIYFGFGSMPFNNQKTNDVVLSALKNWGGRVLVDEGWGGIHTGDLPGNFCVIKDVPHQELFKHVSAVVHHGGAGSTAAGLRAGLPTLIVSHIVDQPFWGARVHALQCGPKPIRMRHLTIGKLVKALDVLVSNSLYRQNAELLGLKLGNENGVSEAVDWIEHNYTKLRVTI
ncbi:MAG: glycosyltransferase family 1 protein [Cohaesibacteraceae bacterium]|nr:glycosyltransferase family 1 protein [Cohaesibacteraceae bacterium]